MHQIRLYGIRSIYYFTDIFIFNKSLLNATSCVSGELNVPTIIHLFIRPLRLRLDTKRF